MDQMGIATEGFPLFFLPIHFLSFWSFTEYPHLSSIEFNLAFSPASSHSYSNLVVGRKKIIRRSGRQVISFMEFVQF